MSRPAPEIYNLNFWTSPSTCLHLSPVECGAKIRRPFSKWNLKLTGTCWLILIEFMFSGKRVNEKGHKLENAGNSGETPTVWGSNNELDKYDDRSKCKINWTAHHVDFLEITFSVENWQRNANFLVNYFVEITTTRDWWHIKAENRFPFLNSFTTNILWSSVLWRLPQLP